MSHVPHELAEEFPADIEVISRLRADNAHFDRLCNEYHDKNREVHRAETDIEPTDDFHMVELRKQRLALKDEIAHMISEAKAETA